DRHCAGCRDLARGGVPIRRGLIALSEFAAIRPSRFYGWDEAARSRLCILRRPPAGVPAVAARQLVAAVYPPDLAECPVAGGRRHPAAGQADRSRGIADSC